MAARLLAALRCWWRFGHKTKSLSSAGRNARPNPRPSPHWVGYLGVVVIWAIPNQVVGIDIVDVTKPFGIGSPKYVFVGNVADKPHLPFALLERINIVLGKVPSRNRPVFCGFASRPDHVRAEGGIEARALGRKIGRGIQLKEEATPQLVNDNLGLAGIVYNEAESWVAPGAGLSLIQLKVFQQSPHIVGDNFGIGEPSFGRFGETQGFFGCLERTTRRDGRPTAEEYGHEQKTALHKIPEVLPPDQTKLFFCRIGHAPLGFQVFLAYAGGILIGAFGYVGFALTVFTARRRLGVILIICALGLFRGGWAFAWRLSYSLPYTQAGKQECADYARPSFNLW